MRTVGLKIVPVLDWKLVGGVETHFDGSKTQKMEKTFDMNSITHHTITITLQDMLATPKFYWQCLKAFFMAIICGVGFMVITMLIGELFKLGLDKMLILGIDFIAFPFFFVTGISIIFLWRVAVVEWFVDYKIDNFVQKNKFNDPNSWKVVKDKDWSAFTAKLKYVPKN